jgi:NSS family neurotransmitter:Na+ symporter
VTILGLLTTLGTVFVVYFTQDLKALDTLDFWVGTFLIFILATIQIIVFGWHWGIERGFKEAHQGAAIRIPAFFGVIMKWICPLFLLAIFSLTVLTSVFGFDLSTFKFGAASSYVVDLIGGVKDGKPVATNQAAQLSVALVVIVAFFFGLLSARSKAYKRAEQGLPKHDS